MAKKKQKKRKASSKQKASDTVSDHDLSVEDIPESPSEREALAINESLSKVNTDSLQFDTQYTPPAISTQNTRFSKLQKILIIGVAVATLILVYGLLKSSSKPAASTAAISPEQKTPIKPEINTQISEYNQLTAHKSLLKQTSPSEVPPIESIQQKRHIQKLQDLSSSEEPLSLQLAQTFYKQKDFEKAYSVYYQLQERLLHRPDEELLRDFLLLKMAFCMKKKGDQEQTDHLLRSVAQSHSPILRVIAKYNQCEIQTQRGQYLKAATNAYQIIGLIDTVDYNRDWGLWLQRDCHFHAIEAITRNVLSLCDADNELPPQFWSNYLDLDPFINLDESQLRSFLSSGIEQFNKALLSPYIQNVEYQSSSPRWLIVCDSAPIDEVLSRFAANAAIDVYWSCDESPNSEEIIHNVRKRPISLYLSAATTQQFLTTAAGSVGLIAQMDDEKTVRISDMFNYSSLSEYINLLAKEAISLWQRLLITSYNQKYAPKIHFAIGLLKAQLGNLTEAIAEYKLIANRFPHTSIAPYALLHSSKQKVKLRDYLGAREDLKHLVEQYPDTDLSEKACLYLADATMKAKLWLEAARIYRKVYNLGLSLESQTKSAIAAGKCYYEAKDYEAAAKWLIRYINLTNNQTEKDFYLAWFLLGKSYIVLNKTQQACDAFQYILTDSLPKQLYIEAISTLAEAHIQQGHFIDALNIFEKADSQQFTQEEYIKLLLAKASILRSMGLIDKAITVLGDKAEFLPNSKLKARILYELAKCSIAQGDLEKAHNSLTDVLVLVEPGPFAHRVAYELAEVCFKLGQSSQTNSICLQILKSNPEEKTKLKTQDLLAKVYKQQKNYDQAILTLIGQLDNTERKDTKKNSTDSTVKDQVLF